MSSKTLRDGEIFVWLTGAALGMCLLILVSLLGLISWNALGAFWPGSLARIELNDSSVVLGKLVGSEVVKDDTGERERIKVKRGNRDIYGQDFIWIESNTVREISYPKEFYVVERLEWGEFYGVLTGQKKELNAPVVEISDSEFATLMSEAEELRGDLKEIEQDEIGWVSYQQEKLRLKQKRISLAPDSESEVAAIDSEIVKLQEEFRALQGKADKLKSASTQQVLLSSVEGEEKQIPARGIVRAHQPNAMGLASKSAMYIENVWRFLTEEPREANTEGGVAPAIFGTVLMVFIMTIVVTPLGVLGAIYLHEYAKPGLLVTLVRIAVNNLAGVPSIVFGVFGVGFFIYFVGGSIDQFFFADSLPAPTYGTGGILWASLTLALLTVPTVIVAAEEGLSTIPNHWREASYALGATKFETIWKVVLPALSPAILTGVILAIARAAGEVAPLMITGVVKHAPALPVDSYMPFVHLDRKFMHLGFHIYDLGFQSPNVDAARPMVFATTFLLIALVILLNSVAIVARARLTMRLRSGTV